MNLFNGLSNVWLWMKTKFKMLSYFMQNISAQAQKSCMKFIRPALNLKGTRL